MAYLHHVLIHFPVALGAVAALFVVLSWLRPAGPWGATARALAYLAALGAIAAAVTGLVAASHVAEMGGDADAVRRHRNVALPAAIALVIAALVTWGTVRAPSGRAAKVAGVLSILAAVAVGYGAHLGGDMLHPGLAPWSDAEHRHGGPGMATSAMPEGHHGATGGAMPPGHDMGAPPSGEPGAGSPSAEAMPPGHVMPGAGASADPSAAAPPVRPRAPSTSIQSSAPNPTSDGALPSRSVTPGTSPPPASPPPAPPPHGADGHKQH